RRREERLRLRLPRLQGVSHDVSQQHQRRHHRNWQRRGHLSQHLAPHEARRQRLHDVPQHRRHQLDPVRHRHHHHERHHPRGHGGDELQHDQHGDGAVPQPDAVIAVENGYNSDVLSVLETQTTLDLGSLPATEVEALYVHIPFCFHKCHYCDFYSITHQSPE